MVSGRARRAPMIFDSMRRHLAQELPEPLLATVDLSIKDRVRLLRLPNMIHEKSGLYKVILNAVEIERLTPREIRDLAREPRPLRSTDETGLVSRNHIDANPPGMELFQRVRRQAARLARKPFVYRFHRPDDSVTHRLPMRRDAENLGKSHRGWVLEITAQLDSLRNFAYWD